MSAIARLLAPGLAVALAGFAGARAESLSGPALARALQKGGYVVVMRHTASPTQRPQAADADAENLAHERQLDATGRDTAAAMGRAIKALRIPVGAVWTSPTFRARQTIALAGLPTPTAVPQLGDGGASMAPAGTDQAAWLKAKAAEPPRPGTDTVVVTHLPNLKAAFGQDAAEVADGGALVFHPLPGQPPELVGRIAIEDWPQLAAGR